MTETVTIPRLKLEDEEPGPGWISCSRYDNGEPCKPLIKCKCGKVTGIGLHHVHADGRVTASYYDSEGEEFEHNGTKYKKDPGCGWHVFLILAGYDQGEFPPNP